MAFRIKNWKRYQHYSHRSPPWIKLHRTLFDDLEWFELDPAAAKTLVSLWLLASESDDGTLPDAKTIAFRLRTSVANVSKHLKTLVHWVQHDASDVLAPCKQNVTTETETELETEKRQTSSSGDDGGVFDIFWKSYPRKIGKQAARRAWKANVHNGDAAKIEAALAWQTRSEQWMRDGGQFVPHPATYLNQHRWEDEPPPATASVASFLDSVEEPF